MKFHPLEQVNPVSRIIGIMVLATPLIFTLDWVTSIVAVALVVVLAPFGGICYAQIAARIWPVLLVTPVAGLSMLLYAQPGGREYFSFWLITISDNSIQSAIAIMVRVVAVTLPVIVLSIRLDPTDLGDGLAQVLKLPARFVIGAVAGARLVTLFSEDWSAMSRARRARGIADRGRLIHLFTMTFGLLVLSLRRASKLAVAMEARGFGRAGNERTWARPSRVGIADACLLVVCAVIPTIAILTSVAVGTFRPLVG